MTNRIQYNIIIICFFLMLFVLLVFLEIKRARNFREKYANQTIETFNDIKFKGKIISVYKHNCGGRIYGIMCVQLDYSNVDSFYVYNDMNCLKIVDGIATLPTNCIHPNDTFDERSNKILQSTYIKVNMDKPNHVIYMNLSGNNYTESVDFPSRPFSEDLFNRISFECRQLF